MNRGSSAFANGLPSGGLRFNEAPIHESGKWAATRRPAPYSGRRFNEAPIHESGKCSRPVGESRPGSRFNEAPIHESGK